jgi:hypothetical protein
MSLDVRPKIDYAITYSGANALGSDVDNEVWNAVGLALDFALIPVFGQLYQALKKADS